MIKVYYDIPLNKVNDHMNRMLKKETEKIGFTISGSGIIDIPQAGECGRYQVKRYVFILNEGMNDVMTIPLREFANCFINLGVTIQRVISII